MHCDHRPSPGCCPIRPVDSSLRFSHPTVPRPRASPGEILALAGKCRRSFIPCDATQTARNAGECRWSFSSSRSPRGRRSPRDRDRRSTSTATSARSCPTSASPATGPTRSSARPSSGSTRRRAPSAAGLGRAGGRPRASPTRASCTQRITSDDADERMPPAKSGKTLTPPRRSTAQGLDRAGGRVPSGTGRSSRRSGRALPAVTRPRLVPQPDRPLRPRPAGEGGAHARRPRPTGSP